MSSKTIPLNLSERKLLKLSRKLADQEGTCLLFSGGNYSSAKHSYLCVSPLERIDLFSKTASLYNYKNQTKQIFHFQNPWEGLKQLIKLNQVDRESPLPEWVGYLAYEMGAFSDDEKKLILGDPKIPLASFYKPGAIIHFAHSTKSATLHLFDQNKIQFSTPKRNSILTNLKEIIKEELYLEQIAQAKEEIAAGNIYQVNLSHQCLFEGHCNPFALFHSLISKNPAPFSAYLKFSDFCIVSSSPERLLKKTGLKLETRPIKGTRARGKNSEEDSEIRQTLLNSDKERAELLMIIDLLRNDLGKISKPGSVQVHQLYHLETYNNVFHLLSIIESECLTGFHPVDIFKAVFPGGSITGCPKLKAMEIIHRLEKRARGIYTGSIGYFMNNGDFDFNIAIRTSLIQDKRIELQLGGAITYDSDPKKEYEETLHKGATFFKILGSH